MEDTRTRFIIVATQRSGTRFLETTLKSHPHISVSGERLLYGNPNNFYDYWLQHIGRDPVHIRYDHAARLFLQFVDSYYDQRFAQGARAVGFDIKYNQFNTLGGMMKLLQSRPIKVIHLVRANILNTQLSKELNYRKTVLGRKAHGTEHVAPQRIHIDVADFLTKVKALDEQIADFRQQLNSRFDTLEIGYEEMTASGHESHVAPEVLQRVLAFLGVDSAVPQLESPLKKTNPRSQRDKVENYDEFLAAVLATPWAHHLNSFPDGCPPAQRLAEGERQFAAGQLQMAEETFRALAQSFPHYAHAANDLGVCLHQEGRGEEARQWLQRAAALEPGNEVYAQNLRLLGQ